MILCTRVSHQSQAEFSPESDNISVTLESRAEQTFQQYITIMLMSLDSGMLVVVTIIAMYMTLVFILLFYVKNEWCDILHYNLTVSIVNH